MRQRVLLMSAALVGALVFPGAASAADSSTTSTPSSTTTIPDGTPPVITIPGLETCAIDDPLNMQPCLVVEATDGNGVIVDYEATATDDGGIESFSCDPPSGSTLGIVSPGEIPDEPPSRLPIDDTEVTCTAIDLAGNQTEEVFWVIVVLVSSEATTTTAVDADDPTLPLTGAHQGGQAGVGLALIATGVLLVVAARTRRNEDSDQPELEGRANIGESAGIG